jgi:hypothetical protein
MELRVNLSGKGALVAVLLLLVLAASAIGSFVHTDDGCAVERHCLACRTALASSGAALPDVPQLAVSHEVTLVRAERPALLRAVELASEPSRGPPRAL